MGAELKNFIQEQGWNLTLRFGVKNIFFFSGNNRLFGFNLFTTRARFTFCGITEEELISEGISIVSEYQFTSYPQYSQLVCSRGPTVEDLRELFEFVYRKAQSLQSTNPTSAITRKAYGG